MKKYWWKILASVLVFYSLLVGLIVPARPGIISGKSELRIVSGKEQNLKIKFYNSKFNLDKPENIKVRLRIDSTRAICADKTQVLGNRVLSAKFNIPSIDLNSVKSPFPFLEIGSPENGYIFSAVYLTVDSSSLKSDSTQNFCKTDYIQPKSGISFPFLNVLEETIRNLFYHVPMWFGMMLLLLVSVIYSIAQLANPTVLTHDIAAKSFAGVGVLYGILGVVTGALWAKHTWGEYWSWDVKQNTSAVALLIYMAYFVLRSSFEDSDKKAKVSAVYNIFAFATLIPLLYIIPRMVDSLHPGAEGNPAFSSYDLDSTLRLVFYPSVIGWILVGVWIADLWIRIDKLWQKKMEIL